MSIVSTEVLNQLAQTQPRPTDSQACVEPILKAALHGPAGCFLSSSGKRIRAAMVTESFRAAGGTGDAPPQIAEAIELLHAGSLIIDDIEDDSETRRGQLALHRDVGLPIALNIGNWLYFQSLERLGSAPLPSSAVYGMLRRSLRTIRRCHEGQALDLGTEVNAIPVTQIQPIASQISRLKTGGLTALSAWLGATAAGSDAITSKALWRFGMTTGVCLQMANDLQELGRFAGGEARCDDLRNARVTWGWAWASRIVPEAKMVAIQRRLRNAGDDVEQLRQIAAMLVKLVGSRGDRYVHNKLQSALRLLGEHVESTQGLRATIQRLTQKR